MNTIIVGTVKKITKYKPLQTKKQKRNLINVKLL